MKHTPEFILILFLSYFLSSCTESGPALNPSEVLLISTQMPAATATATEAATSTKAATPSEVPLFTEAQVEAASPFDDSTWPDIINETQEHPELATEQQWQDEYQWVLAIREKDGIPTTTENNYNPQLQSFSNALAWEQTHPDEVAAGKKVAIAPVEYREMIKESKNFTERISLSPNDLQGWNFENIGPILGQNLDAERRPFDTVSGKLAGFGTIAGQDVLLIDTKDIDGHNILFPIVVYVEKGPTLLKGSKCVVTDLSYSNRHGGDSTFTLKYDTELGPLGWSNTGKAVSWKDLLDALGKEVDISGGGYMGELSDKIGVPEIHGFTPLGLEMADGFYVHTK